MSLTVQSFANWVGDRRTRSMPDGDKKISCRNIAIYNTQVAMHNIATVGLVVMAVAAIFSGMSLFAGLAGVALFYFLRQSVVDELQEYQGHRGGNQPKETYSEADISGKLGFTPKNWKAVGFKVLNRALWLNFVSRPTEKDAISFSEKVVSATRKFLGVKIVPPMETSGQSYAVNPISGENAGPDFFADLSHRTSDPASPKFGQRYPNQPKLTH